MTLEGTNAFLLKSSSSSSRVVVVDPGPPTASHLRALLERGEVELILLTHHHLDHSEGAAQLAALTGAPVRAADPVWCIGGDPLRDGEKIDLGGLSIEVIATPGHTSDSVCFYLPGDKPMPGDMPPGSVRNVGSVLSGDTILGRGTTVIAAPDGSLKDYLSSMRRLVELGSALLLPGHGPRRSNLGAVAAEHLKHRLQRLTEVRSAVDTILRRQPSAEITVSAVTDLVYSDVPPYLRSAAEMTTAAQLTYIAEESDRR